MLELGHLSQKQRALPEQLVHIRVHLLRRLHDRREHHQEIYLIILVRDTAVQQAAEQLLQQLLQFFVAADFKDADQLLFLHLIERKRDELPRFHILNPYHLPAPQDQPVIQRPLRFLI
ncbi:hypothetical protein D1872_269700 [compost metagenome]